MDFNPVEAFRQEAEELLARVEDIALTLRSGSSSEEVIHELFRAFHTIKGSGAMCGLERLAAFTHRVETVLDRVRAGALPVSAELVSVVLAAKDQIKILIESELAGEPPAPGACESLITRLDGFSVSSSPAPPPTPESSTEEEEERLWEIRFRPDPGILLCGGNPALLLRDLRELGPCEITAHTDCIPPLDEIRPDACYLWWTVQLRSRCGLNAIRDVFVFVEDGSDIQISPVEVEAAAPVAEAPREAPSAPEVHNRTLAKESTVRVPAGRLDRLVNLVGELVMNQSRLAQAASQIDAAELAGPVEEIERLIAELRDDVLSIRMMPIGSIFGRFRRLIHDLSAELGKEVDLITSGEETELDKSILDQLGEPLVHLLRNSLDHGIEPAAERVAAGKPERGTIRLSAEHTGSSVVVRVSDDGRGLDIAAVRAKAVEKQLIAADANLGEKEIFNLILLPGFSTARAVTSVSGRGVGMDVVKRQIDALRGSLDIGSQAGAGTSVALTLPLTLAIIDGLNVEIGRDQFIVPMSAVTENVELHSRQKARNNGRNVANVRGELIPYIDLRTAFAIPGQAPEIEKIVIVQHGAERVGLVVDRVLGTHQTVIQSLGRFFRNITVLSGATIMGDGRVALILDVAGIVRFVHQYSRAGLTAAAC